VTRLAAVICFLAGILLSVLLARLLAGSASWRLLSTEIGIEMFLIMAAFFAFASQANARKEIFVVCFALAFGLQNGAFRRTGGISVHTNYLTGMITGLVIAEAEKLGPRSVFHEPPSPEPKLRLICGIWIAFALGAVTGASLALHFEKFAILGAALLLVALVPHALRRAPEVS
jgi:uncharacterized membrane protein YoaK (UPF0700 family)